MQPIEADELDLISRREIKLCKKLISVNFCLLLSLIDAFMQNRFYFVVQKKR